VVGMSRRTVTARCTAAHVADHHCVHYTREQCLQVALQQVDEVQWVHGPAGRVGCYLWHHLLYVEGGVDGLCSGTVLTPQGIGLRSLFLSKLLLIAFNPDTGLEGPQESGSCN
jgi:hypothetical protein